MQVHQPLTLSIKGVVSQPIPGGEYVIHAKFDNIPMPIVSGNLSELITLPIAQGPVVMQRTVTEIDQLPTGKLDVNLVAITSSGTRMMCVQIEAMLTQKQEETLPTSSSSSLASSSVPPTIDTSTHATAPIIDQQTSQPQLEEPVMVEELPKASTTEHLRDRSMRRRVGEVQGAHPPPFVDVEMLRRNFVQPPRNLQRRMPRNMRNRNQKQTVAKI